MAFHWIYRASIDGGTFHPRCQRVAPYGEDEVSRTSRPEHMHRIFGINIKVTYSRHVMPSENDVLVISHSMGGLR